MLKISLKSKVFILCFKTVVLFLLTACSPNFAKSPGSPSSSSSPHIAEHSFVSFDSTALPLRMWLPADEVKGVVIALDGFNDYSNFIKDAAPFFNKRKLALYAYDQRGFGQSTTRGKWSGWQAMTNDLATFVTIIKQKYPDTPVYILGDSMGGSCYHCHHGSEQSPGCAGSYIGCSCSMGTF